MRSVAALLLLLAGCWSAPIPQEPASEPLLTREIERLSEAGISDDVIAELIRTHGVAGEESARAPEPRFVYRELFIPLWPSYSGGRWRLGLRIECSSREEAQEPDSSAPLVGFTVP